MAVSLKVAGTIVTGSGTSLTVTVPSGAASGDYLVAVLYDQNAQVGDWDMGATGFARIGAAHSPSDSGTRTGGLYALLLSSAPAASYTFGFATTGGRMVGVILVFGGVDSTTPVDSSSGWTSSSATATSISVPTGGTTGGDYSLEFYDSDYASPNSYAVTSYTGGLTEIATMANPSGTENTGVSRSMVRVYGDVAPSGGVPAHVITTTGSSSHRAVYLVSLKAAGSAPALTASAALSGSGTLTATQSSLGTGSAPLSGSGTLTSTQRPVLAAPAALTGSGTLSGGPWRRGYSSVAELLSQPKFYAAHRGGSSDYPEMSLYAYEQSALRGYPALELSMARTSDGVWFGLHDASLDRTSLGTGGGSGTSLVASSMTWAQVQTYSILGSTAGNNPTQANRPYMRWEQIIAEFYPSHVIFVDPKTSAGTAAYRTELLNMMDALAGNPRDHFIGKSYGIAGGAPESSGWNLDCHARGYKTWGYFYESDSANYTAYAPRWDILGQDYTATQAAWDSLRAAAPGKPVMAHVLPDTASVTTANARGANGYMVSGTVAIVPPVMNPLAALTGTGSLAATGSQGSGLGRAPLYRAVGASWVAASVTRL